jgi:hypothetical protein
VVLDHRVERADVVLRQVDVLRFDIGPDLIRRDRAESRSRSDRSRGRYREAPRVPSERRDPGARRSPASPSGSDTGPPHFDPTTTSPTGSLRVANQETTNSSARPYERAASTYRTPASYAASGTWCARWRIVSTIRSNPRSSSRPRSMYPACRPLRGQDRFGGHGEADSSDTTGRIARDGIAPVRRLCRRGPGKTRADLG